MSKRHTKIGTTTVVVAVIATLFLTMLATASNVVKADHGYGPGCDTGYHWNSDTGNCVENSYVQHAKITPVTACCSWDSEGFSCKRFCDDDSFHGSFQLQLQQQPIAFKTDNCFWSYPVQCNSLVT